MKNPTPYYAEIVNKFKEAGAYIITYMEDCASLDKTITMG